MPGTSSDPAYQKGGCRCEYRQSDGALLKRDFVPDNPPSPPFIRWEMGTNFPIPLLSKLRRDWVIINSLMPKHNVTFHPSERKISVDEEENLLQAAMEAGIHINASCGGSATCGKCKVKILKGAVDSPKHPKLTQWEYDEGYRLACLTPIRE